MKSALHIRDSSSHAGAGVLVAGLRVSLVLYLELIATELLKSRDMRLRIRDGLFFICTVYFGYSKIG